MRSTTSSIIFATEGFSRFIVAVGISDIFFDSLSGFVVPGCCPLLCYLPLLSTEWYSVLKTVRAFSIYDGRFCSYFSGSVGTEILGI
jgi:hypothetical protein